MDLDKILSEQDLNCVVTEVIGLISTFHEIKDPVQAQFIKMKLKKLETTLKGHIIETRKLRYQLIKKV